MSLTVSDKHLRLAASGFSWTAMRLLHASAAEGAHARPHPTPPHLQRIIEPTSALRPVDGFRAEHLQQDTIDAASSNPSAGQA